VVAQVTGGLVVTPDGVRALDVVIEGERIRELATPGTRPRRKIDASGCYVLPGGVDPHTHLLGDVGTSTAAAAVGGTTTAISFTLPEPGEKPAGALARARDDHVPSSHVDVALHAYVAEPGRLTRADVDEVAELGAAGIKLFTAYPELGLQASDRVVYETCRAAAPLGLPVLVHCENGDVIAALVDELLAAGRTDAASFAAARPPEVEEEAVARVLALAGLAGARLYVVHVSTQGALEILREGRRHGGEALVEVCIHHLALDASRAEGPDAGSYLTVPPLRSREHVEALWKGLRDGSVATVGSDHAPRPYQPPPAEDFTGLPYGFAGIGARLPLLLSLGRERGLALERICELACASPARIFGLAPRKGAIVPGADADLVLWDPDLAGTLESPPYGGVSIRGRIRSVLLRGAPVVEDGRLLGAKPAGRYVSASGRPTPEL